RYQMFLYERDPLTPLRSFPTRRSSDLVGARVLPDTQHLAHVDAYNVTLQRQLTSTISAEVAYVGNTGRGFAGDGPANNYNQPSRSEEHTSELQSRSDLVCRLLLEKKNK